MHILSAGTNPAADVLPIAVPDDCCCAAAVPHRLPLPCRWRSLHASQDYSHFTFEPALSGADGSAPIATLNLALLGVLAALRGTVSPSLLPWADLLLKAISRHGTAQHGTAGGPPVAAHYATLACHNTAHAMRCQAQA